MTLREVVILVIEAVERALYLNRLRVGAYAFGAQGREQVLQAARCVNGSAGWIAPERDAPCDILLLDHIPLEWLPRLALGLREDALSSYLGRMAVAGKTIVVLGRAPEPEEHAPQAYRALLHSYRKILGGYGYLFLGEQAAEAGGGRAVYAGNVLSRKELLQHAAGGRIRVAPEVVVTPLAREAAREQGIVIIREQRQRS